MKQSNPQENPAATPNTSQPLTGRTSRIVRIGQCWERKRDRLVFRIYQIHRKDRGVHLVPVELHRSPNGSDVVAATFAELRAKYRLVKNITRGQG